MATKKNIAIFGASSGLGRATARKAAAMGWHVLAVGRNAAALAAVADEAGGHFAVADICDEAAVMAALADVPSLDHVVVTAGTVRGVGIMSGDMADLRQAFEERIFGAMHVVRAAVPKMQAGSFTFVTGDLADRPRGHFSSVSAAAAGVEVLAKAWAQELAPLRFNIISPGVIDTELQDKLMGKHKAAFMESVVENIPVGHVGHRHDVADAIVGMATNPFISGAVLNIDGGMRLKA